MARPAITLILVSRHSVVRADFRRGAVPFGEWSQPRPELPDLASVVEYAISLGPRPGRAVWVLATDLWTQTLALPVAKVAGLKTDDLAQALAFEAESFSGIPAYESAIGAVAFPPSRGERPCWLTQIRAPEREAIVEAVARSGGTLAGIVHPGGLPQRLYENIDGPFERLELWPDAVIGLRRDAEGRFESRVWNSDPPMNKWQADAANWLKPEPVSDEAETLVIDGIAEPRDRLAPLVNLDDKPALGKWLAAWAGLLASRDRRVPVIAAPVQAMSMGARLTVAIALGLFVAALCGLHAYFSQKQLDELNTVLNREKDTLKRADDFNKMVDGKVAEREKLRGERAKLEEKFAGIAKEMGVVHADRAKADAELQAQREELLRTRMQDETIRTTLAKAQAAEAKLFREQLQMQREAQTDELRRHRERFARLLQELAKRKPDDLVIQKVEQSGNTITVSGLALMSAHPDRYATDLAPVLRPCGWSVQPAKTSINKVDDAEFHSFSIAIADMAKLPDAEAKP